MIGLCGEVGLVNPAMSSSRLSAPQNSKLFGFCSENTELWTCRAKEQDQMVEVPEEVQVVEEEIPVMKLETDNGIQEE